MVRVDAAPSTAVGQVIPVDVDLETRKPRTIDPGPGLLDRYRSPWQSQLDAPLGQPRSDSYGFESEISQPKQNVGAWYDIPLDPPLTDKLRLAAGFLREPPNRTQEDWRWRPLRFPGKIGDDL